MSRSKGRVSIRTVNESNDLIEQFRKDCILRGMTPESIVRYISTLRIFQKYTRESDIDLLQVDENMLRKWLEHLHLERNVSQDY